MSAVASRYHHGDLPAALLRAALGVLAEQEAAGLTLREVARRAGVSAMAPYRHFPDKDALLAAVAGHGFRELEARMQAARGPGLARDAPSDPGRAFIDQGIAYVAFACESPALFRLMFGRQSRLKDRFPALRAAMDAARAALIAEVTELAPWADAAERGVFALSAWSLVHGLASLAVDGRLDAASAAPAVLAERVCRVLGAGIAAMRHETADPVPAPDAAPEYRRDFVSG